jgi:hypothetical protein
VDNCNRKSFESHDQQEAVDFFVLSLPKTLFYLVLEKINMAKAAQ